MSITTILFDLDGTLLMYLNGKPLTVSQKNELPEIKGKQTKAGIVELAPCTSIFIVME